MHVRKKQSLLRAGSDRWSSLQAALIENEANYLFVDEGDIMARAYVVRQFMHEQAKQTAAVPALRAVDADEDEPPCTQMILD